MEVVPIEESHRDFVDSQMCAHFGSGRVVSLGRLHETSSLPGLVALVDDAPAGFLIYDLRANQCEIVALVSVIRPCGVARELVGQLRALAGSSGADTLVLATTNDNVSAQAFYTALGFSLVSINPGAVTGARRLKPEIPLVGEGGVRIEDELEFELPPHA